MEVRIKYSIVHYHGKEGLQNREKRKTKTTRSSQLNMGCIKILVYFHAI